MTRTSTHRRIVGMAIALAALAACSSTTSGSGAGSTTTAASSTVAPPVTDAPSTTVAPATTAAPAPTTAGGSSGSTCDGAAGIPAGASNLNPIKGDIDGDLKNDTVTAYTLDGVPRVHAKLASGKQSDVAVQIGFGDQVEISFHDFDHSGGASKPPPVAVLAVGRTKAGTAQFTFLTLTMKYCIRPWHIDENTVFVGEVAAAEPFSGLVCEGAAGKIYTSLTSAESAGAGSWKITTQVLHHDFTLIQFDAPLVITVSATEAEVQQQYGDISGCGRDPLFS